MGQIGFRMVALLFWNTQQGKVGSLVPLICNQYDVDVVVLAEEERTSEEIFAGSFGSGSSSYSEYAPVKSKIRFFFRNGSGILRMVSDADERKSIREFIPTAGPACLVAGAHIISKLRTRESDQYFAARILKNAVEQAEIAVGHNRTIVIGDMNMNPFEEGMLAADGLHGMMTKSIVIKQSRRVQGQKHSFFYNPMWSRLGDESHGPAGTYYHGPGGAISPYWHTFDQALLRPSLVPAYERGFLEVVTQINGTDLLSNTNFKQSDHFPIVLRLIF